MKNEEPLDIPNFNIVASYKRPEVPAAGGAIYHNKSHFITSRMDIHTTFARNIGVNVSDIGEICIARCHSMNRQYILMKIIGRFKSNGLIENKSGRGKKSILSDVAKWKVLKGIKIDNKLSAVKLAAETSRIMG
ncbi:hypothetical protein TNCV_3965381 [Trichonephila clavipes]|nr:hypothetical protein TNCV_3965381 [Trichonephila clavipes]